MLGVKVFGGSAVTAGSIIGRQRGTKFHPGNNVGRGNDDTLFATSPGRVRFSTGKGNRKFVHVDDVAAAVTATVGNSDAAGKAYHLADCYARWADWAVMAAELLGVDAEIDTSSPAQPRNTFSKDPARSLGVQLDRGHEGIREHLGELIALIRP